MARHRRRVTVRDDGLRAVIDPLVTACGIEIAVLVDVESGMLLDAWVRDGLGDAETLGAAHADVVRALLSAGPPASELVLSEDDQRHHVLRSVADPFGGRLALAVVVTGSPRHVGRARRRLREVPDACLTAGPQAQAPPEDPPKDPRDPPLTQVRSPGPADVPALAQLDAGRVIRPVPADALPVQLPQPLHLPQPRRGPAPPSALPPGRNAGGQASVRRLTVQPGRRAADG